MFREIMLLKRLEINGFKSFANKTMLDFLLDSEHGKTHGITAIVGPNGSGKSNIADSIRWVIGEQSMKNLRGKKSEDIIFAGSGKKAKLGSARVTMFLDNSDKKIPLDFSEVSITRKIYRSGESEFLINGSRVRLQDIADLLAKAGIGKESYAIVNQGMADAVLNATPLERRSIIEDAAGVKQYQLQKERSIRKLDSTRENLDKVKALVEEIRPHLKTLKRQAEKAAQSEGVARSLKEKQLELYSFLWHSFQEERAKFVEEKDDMGRQMMNVQREVDKLNDELGKITQEERENNKIAEIEKQIREKKNQLSQLDRELIVTEGRLEIEKEKQNNIRVAEEIKKMESIPVNFSYVKKAIEELRSEQEKLILRLEKVEKLEDLQDIREFARVIQQRLHDLRLDIEKGKKEAVKSDYEEQVAKQKQEMEKKVAEHAKIIADFQAKATKAREAIQKTEKEIKELEEKIEKEATLDKERRTAFFELERNLRAKQFELDKFKDKFNEAKISLARVEVREDDLKNQVRNELKREAETLEAIDGKINRDELEREITKLKVQMEQIGGIDPMVIDEYKETNERFEFLTNESQDLEKAIVSLKEIIREMEHKIKESFDATFEVINKEFSKYFRIIFGGGNAHLTKLKIKSRKLKVAEEGNEETSPEDNLEDTDEREEVGIDISACPPGKKISNLSMLSGGERSLTSLALLFSIISHNPPPFSVLDEVEAALDEANSKRFGRIIQELSTNTQFVTITHNRETMRQASLLYGVTMGDEGISKLLSVKLDQVGQGGKILKQ